MGCNSEGSFITCFPFQHCLIAGAKVPEGNGFVHICGVFKDPNFIWNDVLAVKLYISASVVIRDFQQSQT